MKRISLKDLISILNSKKNSAGVTDLITDDVLRDVIYYLKQLKNHDSEIKRKDKEITHRDQVIDALNGSISLLKHKLNEIAYDKNDKLASKKSAGTSILFDPM